MTATATFPGANYETEGFVLSDTNLTTIYTVPAGFEGGILVTELWAADQDGTANTLLVKVTLDGTARVLGQAEVVPAASHLQMNFTGLVMNEGDIFQVQAASITVDGYLSFIQNAREG
jgi:hypothetical protein